MHGFVLGNRVSKVDMLRIGFGVEVVLWLILEYRTLFDFLTDSTRMVKYDFY